MTRCATRLRFITAQQRKLPQMNFPMRLLDAVDRNALALMTASAADLLRGMGIVREQHFTARVRPKRMRFLFESGAVDREMTGLATVNARHRLVETVTIKFIK